jgi:hypothetical protein
MIYPHISSDDQLPIDRTEGHGLLGSAQSTPNARPSMYSEISENMSHTPRPAPLASARVRSQNNDLHVGGLF